MNLTLVRDLNDLSGWFNRFTQGGTHNSLTQIAKQTESVNIVSLFLFFYRDNILKMGEFIRTHMSSVRVPTASHHFELKWVQNDF